MQQAAFITKATPELADAVVAQAPGPVRASPMPLVILKRHPRLVRRQLSLGPINAKLHF